MNIQEKKSSKITKKEGEKRDLSKDKGNDFTVLVPIQTAEFLNALIPPAIRAAKNYAGKIILLNVIYQLSLPAAEKYVPEREKLLSKGLDMIKKAGYKGEMEVEIAHSTTNVIRQIVRSRKVSLLVMGSRAKPGTIFRNEIPYKLQKLDCSILTVREGMQPSFGQVLVFADKLKNLSEMLSHAMLLAADNGKIQILFDFKETNLPSEVCEVLDNIEHFKNQNPGFSGDITYSRYKETPLARIAEEGKKTQSVGILLRYKGNWLEQLLTMHINNPASIARSVGLPTFLYKPIEY